MSLYLKYGKGNIDKPQIGSVWRHYNGNLYTVQGFTNEHTERPEKYPVMITYLGENGNVWSRPLSRWFSSMTFVQTAAIELDRQGRGEPAADCWSHNDGDSWGEHPADADFVDGLKVGDEYELQASVGSWTERFRVTKAPDDTSDDYEVEPVSIRTAPQPANPTIKESLTVAEPVKEAGDAKIMDAVAAYGAACRQPNNTISEQETRLHEIRALLARYGSRS